MYIRFVFIVCRVMCWLCK